MDPVLQENLPLWCMLCREFNENEELREELIDGMTNKQMCALTNFVKRFLSDKINFDSRMVGKISEDPLFWRNLADTASKEKKTLEQKKESIKQSGGILPILAAVLSPVVGAIGKEIVNAIANKVKKRHEAKKAEAAALGSK